ncbi:hypothetical protein N9091_01415 [bacterium]|nr:hypothetical protein [bacterium]
MGDNLQQGQPISSSFNQQHNLIWVNLLIDAYPAAQSLQYPPQEGRQKKASWAYAKPNKFNHLEKNFDPSQVLG